jgi:hypothetical protein
MTDKSDGAMPGRLIVEGAPWTTSAPRNLACRLLGHRWGEWYDCLRPGLRASECSRCGARKFRDEDGLCGAYSYEDVSL